MTGDSAVPQIHEAHHCQSQTALPVTGLVTIPDIGSLKSSTATYQTVPEEPAARTGCSGGWPAFQCAA